MPKYVNYERLYGLVEDIVEKQKSKNVKNPIESKTPTPKIDDFEANEIRLRMALMNMREKKLQKEKTKAISELDASE